jgi:hypothetical protein
MDIQNKHTKTTGVIKKLIHVFGNNYKEIILDIFKESIFTFENLIKLGKANILCYDFALFIKYKEKTYGAFYISRIIGEIIEIPFQPQKVLRSEDWYDGCIFTKDDSHTKLKLSESLHESINKCVEEYGLLKFLIETTLVKPSHKLLNCNIISSFDDYKCLYDHITPATKRYNDLRYIIRCKVKELKVDPI